MPSAFLALMRSPSEGGERQLPALREFQLGDVAQGEPVALSQQSRGGNQESRVSHIAVAVPTRNDATTGYRFAVTRCRSRVNSNSRATY